MGLLSKARQGQPSQEPEKLGAAGQVWPEVGQSRDWLTSVTGTIIDILRFAGHMISAATV